MVLACIAWVIVRIAHFFAPLFTLRWWKRRWWLIPAVLAGVTLIVLGALNLHYALTDEAVVRLEVDVDVTINQGTSPPEVERRTEPPSPQIVGHMTHEEMIYLLRDIFPFAFQRGAEEQVFDIPTRSDIEQFLQTCSFPSTFNSQGDLMEFLRGNFYSWSQGENIPLGEVKVSDSEFFAITIASGGNWQGQWMVLRINADGSLTAINSPDTREVSVVVH
jgi:hypothetical protein